MKRPQNELNTIGQNGGHAEFLMQQMEDEARRTTCAARNISGKWLCVFCVNNVLSYRWDGGYPTSDVTRDVAVSVLRYM